MLCGAYRGIRRSSELNLAMAVLLMLFVLALGPTLFRLRALVQNSGLYLHHLVMRTFTLYAYEPRLGEPIFPRHGDIACHRGGAPRVWASRAMIRSGMGGVGVRSSRGHDIDRRQPETCQPRARMFAYDTTPRRAGFYEPDTARWSSAAQA